MGALFTGSAQTLPPQDSQAAPPQTQALTADQLTDLVAPTALYPDGLLSQALVASTYPLEVVEAQQWLQKNPTLHGTELTHAVQQESWDPSVQALVAFPDVLKRLNQDIRWTTGVPCPAPLAPVLPSHGQHSLGDRELSLLITKAA